MSWLRRLLATPPVPPAPSSPDPAIEALRSEVAYLRRMLEAAEAREARSRASEERVREELLTLIDRKAHAEVEHYRWVRAQAAQPQPKPDSQAPDEEESSGRAPGPMAPWTHSLLAQGHFGEPPYPSTEADVARESARLAAEMGIKPMLQVDEDEPSPARAPATNKDSSDGA